MVRFKAQGTQRRFPPKYNGNQGYPEYFCTFTSLEIHSKSDPKRRYKNVRSSCGKFHHIFELEIIGFPFFNEK